MRQQTLPASLPLPTEQARAVGGFLSSGSLKHPTWVDSRGQPISAQRASPETATLTSCVEFRPGTRGTDTMQR